MGKIHTNKRLMDVSFVCPLTLMFQARFCLVCDRSTSRVRTMYIVDLFNACWVGTRLNLHNRHLLADCDDNCHLINLIGVHSNIIKLTITAKE